jgi:hypothetical protein
MATREGHLLGIIRRWKNGLPTIFGTPIAWYVLLWNLRPSEDTSSFRRVLRWLRRVQGELGLSHSLTA